MKRSLLLDRRKVVARGYIGGYIDKINHKFYIESILSFCVLKIKNVVEICLFFCSSVSLLISIIKIASFHSLFPSLRKEIQDKA